MRCPRPPGEIGKALTPFVEELAQLEERALRGEAMSVVELSTQLSASFSAAGREAMERLLDQAARAQLGSVACPSCAQPAESKGFEDTFFIGRFGRVPVSRRRFTHCGQSWFPMDAAWGLPTGEYADDVREATDRLSCRLGFDEAVAELKHLWGLAPDGSTAKRWIGQDGAQAAESVRTDAEEHWKQYEEQAFAEARGDERPPERIDGFGVVEVDGVHALTWKPGQEPRRRPADEPGAAPHAPDSAVAPIASETAERAAHHRAPSALSDVPGSPMAATGRSPRVHGREVCVGLTYRSQDACEESPGRGVLLEKRYVAALNDREGFWTDLHAAAAMQGALAAKTLVRVSDGGGYFIDTSDELFRDQPLVGILDIQHARQHVWEAGHKVVSDSKKTVDWVLPLTQLISDGKVDDVISRVDGQRADHTGQTQLKAIDALTGYLTRHKHLMDYPRYRDAGYPIASAAVESTNKRLVGRRCKQGGMIWSEPGLEHMVAMRLAFYNPGAWQRLWPHTAGPTAASAAS